MWHLLIQVKHFGDRGWTGWSKRCILKIYPDHDFTVIHFQGCNPELQVTLSPRLWAAVSLSALHWIQGLLFHPLRLALWHRSSLPLSWAPVMAHFSSISEAVYWLPTMGEYFPEGGHVPNNLALQLESSRSHLNFLVFILPLHHPVAETTRHFSIFTSAFIESLGSRWRSDITSALK